MSRPTIPFVQAYHYTAVPLNAPRRPKVIVLHSMEAPEKGKTAENVAEYFRRGCPDGSGKLRPASAHVNFDADSIVQSVQLKDVAYGAPGMNRYGIHFEHAGYARQTRTEWLDAYGVAMLTLSAKYAAFIVCPKFNITVQRLTDDQLRAAARGEDVTGFCTHADLTRALKQGSHSDPGAGFPFDWYISKVSEFRRDALTGRDW